MHILIHTPDRFTDYALLCRKCDRILVYESRVVVVTAPNRLVERYARERGYGLRILHPQAQFGSKATQYLHCDLIALSDEVILFVDPASEVDPLWVLASEKGLPVRSVWVGMEQTLYVHGSLYQSQA